MARKRIGRPPEFKDRARLTLLLERHELRALHRLARRQGVSASAFARRLVQTALKGGTD